MVAICMGKLPRDLITYQRGSTQREYVLRDSTRRKCSAT